MDNNKTRILIIEDEAVIALNISEIVSKGGHLVAGIVHNDIDAIDKLAQCSTDLVLLDINLNGNFEGFKVAKVIQEKYKIPFIFITSYSGDSVVNKAKIYQPAGYIVKPFAPREVLAAITIAWYNFEQSGLKYIALNDLNKTLINPISKKEYEILLELIEGSTYKQIAEKQFLSINTINSHVKNIYNKIGIHSKTEALQLMIKK